jgi:hypothetical protein
LQIPDLRRYIISIYRRFSNEFFVSEITLRNIYAIITVAVQLFACQILVLSVYSSDTDNFSSGRTGFEVKFKDEVSPYNVIGVFLLPEESITIEVRDHNPGTQYSISISGGTAHRIDNKRWNIKAEKNPGLYPAIIYNPTRTDSVIMNIFVMVPRSAKRDGSINGYRIGHYPINPPRGLKEYRATNGLIEVTTENEDTYISPHFQLKQFVCKQSGDYPKYIVLQERLLLKLQIILERVNQKGIYANTFHIMSGYRTPYYNRAIGNVQYSRHVYGDAADIFIDMKEPHGFMDDLNGDGKIDHHDAVILYDIIEEIYPNAWYKPFVGGLGLYKERPGVRGPFVHIDSRGTRARWGR